MITACAFIYCDFKGVMKVFLPKRAATKRFLPNVYELPGGHINFGEDIVAGLKREISEEFGMHVRIGDPFAVFTYRNEVKGSHSIEVDYFAQFIDPLDRIKLHPDDHSEFVWADEHEIEPYMTENRIAANEELPVARKGFALLRGGSPDFG